jgi:hypothetical protein
MTIDRRTMLMGSVAALAAPAAPTVSEAATPAPVTFNRAGDAAVLEGIEAIEKALARAKAKLVSAKDEGPHLRHAILAGMRHDFKAARAILDDLLLYRAEARRLDARAEPLDQPMSRDFLAHLAAEDLAKRAELPDSTVRNRYTRDMLAAQSAAFALGAAGMLGDEGGVLSRILAYQTELRERYGVSFDA